MIKLLFTLPLCFYTSLALCQQQNLEEALLKQMPRQVLQASQTTTAHLQNASIRAQRQGSSTVISQNGTLNKAMVEQLGAQNTINLTQQGNYNSYRGSFDGVDNTSEIRQYGDYNELIQEIRTNNMSYKVTQQGQHNALLQVERGTNTVPYEVKQQGSGMRIIIENGGTPILR